MTATKSALPSAQVLPRMRAVVADLFYLVRPVGVDLQFKPKEDCRISAFSAWVSASRELRLALRGVFSKIEHDKGPVLGYQFTAPERQRPHISTVAFPHLSSGQYLSQFLRVVSVYEIFAYASDSLWQTSRVRRLWNG